MSRNHLKLNSGRWRRVRLEVLERDGWRCVQCGKAGVLEVDHITPLELGGEPWALANLQTLCRTPCHWAKTTIENGGEALGPGIEQMSWICYNEQSRLVNIENGG